MNNSPETATAKERVIAWVQSKNPNKDADFRCRYCKSTDMGLQELLIALDDTGKISDNGQTLNKIGNDILNLYNNFENLHNQSEDFYLSLLPLITC